MPDLIVTKDKYKLGELEFDTSHSEGELFTAGMQRNQLVICLQAIAVAASKELTLLKARINELEKQFAPSSEPSPAPAPRLAAVPDEYEPDPEELERDFRERYRKAKAKAEQGAGWSTVVEFAFAAGGGVIDSALKSGDRPPTPTELRRIEQWLNRHATRGGAL
jgi:hypothetical protein